MMCYVHVSTPQEKCNHHILQTCTNKKVEKSYQKYYECYNTERYLCPLHLACPSVKFYRRKV